MTREEIIEMMNVVKDLELAKVKIKTDAYELSIELEGGVGVPNPILPPAAFQVANEYQPPEPATEEGMASPAQVKYARDMVKKEFGNDDSRVREFLAEMMGVMLVEVPSMETWDRTLTREMAGLILDAMEAKRPKRGVE